MNKTIETLKKIQELKIIGANNINQLSIKLGCSQTILLNIINKIRKYTAKKIAGNFIETKSNKKYNNFYILSAKSNHLAILYLQAIEDGLKNK